MTTATTLRRTTVAGIPALWTDLPGDYTATLVVGVGARDLTPTTAGLHHLVEHVVMSRVGHVTVDHNAASSPDSIMFWATGAPARVHDFLHRVAAAATSLQDLTDEELRVDLSTVVAEIGVGGLYAGMGPLAARWGAAGLGLADLDHAALLSLDASDVRAFVDRWFVTGAARLALTREPAPDLAPRLPERTAPVRAPHPPPLDLPTPAVVYGDVVHLTLSFLVDLDRTHRALVGEVVHETLVRRLRRAAGHVYSVDASAAPVAGTTSSWTFALDPPSPTLAREVLREAVTTLRTVATHGPDPEVLAHARETLDAERSLHDARRARLVVAAEADARGDVALPLDDDDDLELDGDAVRDDVAALLASLLVVFPAGLVDDPDAADRLEHELGLTLRTPLRSYAGMSRTQIMTDLLGGGTRTGLTSALVTSGGTFHKGRFFGAARGAEICLGPRQVVLLPGGLKVCTEDVVLCSEDDDGDVELVTRTGASVVVNPRYFRRAARPWARFMSSLPRDVVRSKRGVTALLAGTGTDTAP